MGNACTHPTLEDTSSILQARSFQAYINEKNKNIPQVAHIKLLSYNIFIRPPMISNTGNDFKDKRIKEFLKVIPEYDIICLQEMFGSYSSRRALLIQKAEEAGFLFSTESPRPVTLSSHFIDGGLLILSRYPIIGSEFCHYPQGVGADYYVNKGALYANIKIGNSNLHLYTTHAQATYDESTQYFLRRSDQFIAFKRFINDTLSRHHHCEEDLVLLTGDFNVDGRAKAKFHNKNIDMTPLIKRFPNLGKQIVFSEYDALISCLTDDGKDEVDDILLKRYGEHPITYGDFYLENNEKRPKDVVLTHKDCLLVSESLDYIFKYKPKKRGSGSAISPYACKGVGKQKLDVRESATSVQELFVSGHTFSQLSDHYALTVALEYSQQLSPTQSKAETDVSSGSTYDFSTSSLMKFNRTG